jgi:hypothetical protein
MVSYRAKKKLADRTCMYCGKEFRYPCRLKQHYKTVKCSDSVLSQVSQCSDSVSSQISQCSDSVSQCSDSVSSQIRQCSDSNQKNTVPIQLSLA